MKIQNILISDDELIIINENGGQHHIPTTNLDNPAKVWVDNIKACAISLASKFDESTSFDDWDTTISDGLEEWDEAHSLDMVMNTMLDELDDEDF